MPADLPDALRARLEAADRRAPLRRSVAPARARATPLTDLVAALAAGPEQVEVLAAALERIVRALAEHFPDNLFADLDRLAGDAARRHAQGGTRALSAHVDLVEAIFAKFGRHGPIRFRYVHDFLYGFDWARWVRRDVRRRAGVDPYDTAFLRRMLARGDELEAEIARDGPIYGRLRGPGYRNPFRFSREPDVESRVLRAMAADGHLPVDAHEIGGAVRFDRDFEALRRTYVARG